MGGPRRSPSTRLKSPPRAPGASSAIGNTDDWLHLVFAHEYTHIVHLSRGQGWIGGLRRVFGRLPLLYPNLYLPKWQIEGLARNEESALTGQGRVPDTSFRAIVDVASAAYAVRATRSGGRGTCRLAIRERALRLRRLLPWVSRRALWRSVAPPAHGLDRGRVPYFGSRAFKKVFRRSLGELWREFETASRAEIAPAGAAVSRLTEHGFTTGGPRFGPDGQLYYSVVNPHGFPALLARNPGATTSRKIADRVLGTRVGFAGSEIVFDQIEIENQVGLQSDLYTIRSDGGHPRRLTRGARAADPDVSPDGRVIVCTIQRADRRELATLTVPTGSAPAVYPAPLVSEPGVHFASPRWSPDGLSIAVERVSTAGRAEIVLIDPATGQVARTVASSSGSRSMEPAWMADGRLLFSSDRGGDGFRIFVTDIATRATLRLEDTGANASSPEPSRDGRTLVFVGYTAGGYDLFSLPLGSSRWTPVDPGSTDAPVPPGGLPRVERAPSDPSAIQRRYSPVRTIAPRFWTPTIESDGDELVVGAATAATDALGRHVYAAEAGWSAGRGRPDWQIAYAYDRWRPTVFASVADDTNPFRDGERRTREGNAGMVFPVRRVRWSQSVLGAFHSSVDNLDCETCGPDREVRVARRAVRGGWLLDASRSYGYPSAGSPAGPPRSPPS